MSASKKPEQPAARPSIVSMYDVEDEIFEQVEVGLPPMARQASLGPAAVSSVDLSKMARVWMLIGRGGGGKTTIARWMGEMIAERDRLGSVTLAALDPTNRTLSRFFKGVQQPATAEADDTAAFLRKLVRFTTTRKLGGVWDFGGGDLSLNKLIGVDPKFDQTMWEHGIATVAAYVLTPAIDDLSILATFEQRGFQPKATALILNLGRAPNLAAFAALRAQSAYKDAVARGAVEILMPPLDPAALALEIERKRLHFFHIRDEIVPPGMTSAPIDGIEAMMVRDWLAMMDAAFLPVETWLPWT